MKLNPLITLAIVVLTISQAVQAWVAIQPTAFTFRLPRVEVPVATYTGWNLRNPAIGAETELLSLTGSRIPFPITPAERAQTGDPRQAVRERYADFEDYRSRYMAAADQLVADRYLLAEHLAGLETIAHEHRPSDRGGSAICTYPDQRPRSGDRQ